MTNLGEFVSPGARSPPFYGSSINDAEDDVTRESESFSKAQIDEIERLLDRIGAGDPTDGFLQEDEAEQGEDVSPAAPAITSKNPPTTFTHSGRKTQIIPDKERIWKAHIKDVQAYLEAKHSTTTRAILQERQYRKEAHQSRPWQRKSPNDAAPPLTLVDTEQSANYLIRASDMKQFIHSRSV